MSLPPDLSAVIRPKPDFSYMEKKETEHDQEPPPVVALGSPQRRATEVASTVLGSPPRTPTRPTNGSGTVASPLLKTPEHLIDRSHPTKTTPSKYWSPDKSHYYGTYERMAQSAASNGGVTTGSQNKKLLKGLRSGVPKGLCPGSAQKCKDHVKRTRVTPDSRGLVRSTRKEVDGRRDRWFITHGGLKPDGHGLNPSGGDRLIPVGGTRVVSPDGADLRLYYDQYVTYLMTVPTGTTAISFEEFVTVKVEEVEKAARETEEFLAQLEAEMLAESKEQEKETASPASYSPTHVPLPHLEEDSGKETAELETGRGSAKRRKVLEQEEPPVLATPLVAPNSVQLGTGVDPLKSLPY